MDPVPLSSDVKERLREIPTHLAGLQSHDVEQQLKGAAYFRHLLSADRTPPIDDVLASGAVGLLVRLLVSSDQRVVFEAAW